jgi:hypothetical protein
MNLLCVLGVQSPFTVNFCNVLESMVQVLVVQLQRTYCLDLLLAILINTEGHDLLLMLHASVLLTLTHEAVSIYNQPNIIAKYISLLLIIT